MTTFSITRRSVIPYRKVTFSLMTLSTIKLSMMTLSTIKLSITARSKMIINCDKHLSGGLTHKH